MSAPAPSAAPDEASDPARPGARRHPGRRRQRLLVRVWPTRRTPPLGLHIPWWLLALMFAATEIWVFHIQVGREAQSISISEIPLILALFYALPAGPAGRPRRRARAGDAAAPPADHCSSPASTSALLFADTAVALVGLLLRSAAAAPRTAARRGSAARARVRRPRWPSTWSCSTLIIRWYDGEPAASRAYAASSSGSASRPPAPLLGLVPLLTLRLGSLAAVPLLAAGRRADGRLPRLRLAGRPAHQPRAAVPASAVSSASRPRPTTCCPRCSHQARELLRGEAAEIAALRRGRGRRCAGFDGEPGGGAATPDEAAPGSQLGARAARGAGTALLLRTDDAAGAGVPPAPRRGRGRARTAALRRPDRRRARRP